MKHKQVNLSKNQQIVLETIGAKTIKGEFILPSVKKKGINAPRRSTGIRKIGRTGVIHKIEAKMHLLIVRIQNAGPQATAFSICKKCQKITEIMNSKLSTYLTNFQDNTGMKYGKI